MHSSNWSVLYEKLCQWLERKFSAVSHDLVHDAVQDALCAHIEAPDDYDPTRASLMTYLGQRAISKLSNMFCKVDRQRKLNLAKCVIAQPESYHDNTLDQLIRREEFSRLQRQLCKDEADRVVLEVILELTPQDLNRYAQVAGLSPTEANQVEATYHRHAACMRKRISRLRKEQVLPQRSNRRGRSAFPDTVANTSRPNPPSQTNLLSRKKLVNRRTLHDNNRIEEVISGVSPGGDRGIDQRAIASGGLGQG